MLTEEAQQTSFVNISSPTETIPAKPYEMVQASSGKRFANYIIDLVCFYLLFIFWGVLLAFIAPEKIEELANINGLLDRLVTLVLYALFYGFIEMIFRGRTFGKFITGTKAVNLFDGSDISASTAFKRGLCRAVPFDAFSAIGNPSYPWHDRWTDTVVIDEKLTRENNAW